MYYHEHNGSVLLCFHHCQEHLCCKYTHFFSDDVTGTWYLSLFLLIMFKRSILFISHHTIASFSIFCIIGTTKEIILFSIFILFSLFNY